MKVLKALILIPLAIVIIALAVANRQIVTFSLDPFSHEAPAFSLVMPLFVLMFAALLVGVVLGGVASWVVQGKHRRAAKASRREVDRLRNEADRLKSALGTRSPALPSA